MIGTFYRQARAFIVGETNPLPLALALDDPVLLLDVGEHVPTTAPGAFSVFATDGVGDGDTDILSASLHDDKITWHEILSPYIGDAFCTPGFGPTGEQSCLLGAT